MTRKTHVNVLISFNVIFLAMYIFILWKTCLNYRYSISKITFYTELIHGHALHKPCIQDKFSVENITFTMN